MSQYDTLRNAEQVVVVAIYLYRDVVDPDDVIRDEHPRLHHLG